MDWALVIVGLFAVVAIGLLFDAIRNPERWRAQNVHLWRDRSFRTVAITIAAVLGASLAGGSTATFGVIAAVGVSVALVLLRLWLKAWANQQTSR